MFQRTLFVPFLVYFYFQEILIINAWPTLQVTILNYTNKYNAEYLEFYMVPASEPGDYHVNMTVNRSNVRPILKLGIYFESVEFMNKTIDACKIAHSKNEEPLLRLIAKVLATNQRSSTPKECPVKKGKYYNFLKKIETDKIPPVWPETRVAFYVDIFSKESNRLVPIFSQVLHCQFRKKK